MPALIYDTDLTTHTKIVFTALIVAILIAATAVARISARRRA